MEFDAGVIVQEPTRRKMALGPHKNPANNSYWVYQIARACQALTMGDTTRAISEGHARQIVSLEKFLHIDIELGLQHFVMRHNWLLVFFNK